MRPARWRTSPAPPTGPLWFQQYLFKDRGLTLEMAARAEEAGYSALCITVDAKIKPKRERNIRNDYVGASSPNYAQIDLTEHAGKFAADAPAGPMDIRDPAATWADVDWLAANIRLPVVIKGIMVGEDGKHAADNGAKAVIVSNHGARYLDTTFTTIEVLPEIVEAADGDIEVYMDGGIRRGTDIVKALALGGAGSAHRPAPLLGADGGRRSRRPGRPGDAPRRVGRHDGHVRAPHHRQHRPRSHRHSVPAAGDVPTTRGQLTVLRLWTQDRLCVPGAQCSKISVIV